jgi:hypothetical protein
MILQFSDNGILTNLGQEKVNNNNGQYANII